MTGHGAKMWQDSSSLLGPSSVSHSSVYDRERDRERGSESGRRAVDEEERRARDGGAWRGESALRLLSSHFGASSHRSSHFSASSNGGDGDVAAVASMADRIAADRSGADRSGGSLSERTRVVGEDLSRLQGSAARRGATWERDRGYGDGEEAARGGRARGADVLNSSRSSFVGNTLSHNGSVHASRPLHASTALSSLNGGNGGAFVHGDTEAGSTARPSPGGGAARGARTAVDTSSALKNSRGKTASKALDASRMLTAADSPKLKDIYDVRADGVRADDVSAGTSPLPLKRPPPLDLGDGETGTGSVGVSGSRGGTGGKVSMRKAAEYRRRGGAAGGGVAAGGSQTSSPMRTPGASASLGQRSHGVYGVHGAHAQLPPASPASAAARRARTGGLSSSYFLDGGGGLGGGFFCFFVFFCCFLWAE